MVMHSRRFTATSKADLAPVYPSTAAIDGHPIHLMLIPFPIAFFPAAMVTDIIYLTKGAVVWAQASAWLLGAGITMALVAAVFGAIDFFTIPRVRAHIQGWLHPIFALTTVALATLNFVIRWNDPTAMIQPWGVGLSILTVADLLVTCWLGAELVHHQRIGVSGSMLDEPGVRSAVIEHTEYGEVIGGRFAPQSQQEKVTHYGE